MSILNFKNVDPTKQPAFLGEGLSIQRYDVFKHKKFFQAFLNQIGFFWRPEEVHLGGKERQDFQSLSEHEKFIFTSNLKYQILLDTVASRGLRILMDDVSLTEIESAMTWWSAFEQLHSYSYTYIIKNVYSSPEEIFDHILDDEEIVKRATSVTHYYNELIDSYGNTPKEKKKKIYLALVNMNILEGIRFYVSFACSYCFAQNKKMEGNAKIIKLINRDENVHLGISQSLIRMLRTEKDEGFVQVAKECEDIVYQMYKDAAEEEAQWAKYLFTKFNTGMLGLNEEILVRYMKWLTNKRLRGIGLKHIYEGTQNPIPWITNYQESKSVQVAPQETEIDSYKIGSYVQDMDETDWAKEFNDLL